MRLRTSCGRTAVVLRGSREPDIEELLCDFVSEGGTELRGHGPTFPVNLCQQVTTFCWW